MLVDRGEFGPAWTDKLIIETVGVSNFTVYKLREKFFKEGLEKTIHRKGYDNSNRDRKIDGDAEAKMIVMMQGKPPKGHARWTLELIANQLVELNIIDEDITSEGVRLYKKKSA